MTGRRWALPVMVGALLAPGVAHGQQQSRTVEAAVHAAADPGVLAAEAVSGAAVGLLASLGLAYAGAAILGPHGGEDPGMLGAVTGFLLGMAVGSAVGVHFTARTFGLPARFSEALGGALSGTLALGLLPLDADEPTFWVAVYGMPALGAVLASTLGSESRMRPIVRPADDGVGVGLSVAF